MIQFSFPLSRAKQLTKYFNLGESGAVSLCIDFFDYITDAVAYKITWTDSDRPTWMYEFEVHGIYLGTSLLPLVLETHCSLRFALLYESS
jgi:hypothetical protein